MQKSILAIVVIIIVLAGGLVLATRKSGDNPNTDMSGMNMHQSSSSGSNSATASATNAVSIQNFAFSPANITVKKGTTVTWTNKDGATHTVTENDNQPGPNSGDLAKGKSYSFTYTAAGTFKYHCSIHPDMTGTVTVTE